MVKDTRKALRADAHRTVNAPEPLKVDEDAAGNPMVVRLPRKQTIVAINDHWRIDDEWWRAKMVSRIYFAIRFTSGQKLVIYKDLVNDCWYRQAY